MSGHTPGPWEIWGGSPSIAIAATDCGLVAQTLGGNDEANARLIATSPKLLAALEACVEHGIFPSNVQSVRNTARAVIAEAKGES